MEDVYANPELSAAPTETPGWLDTESLMPGCLRRRISLALEDARRVQEIVNEFSETHWTVFRDYAATTADVSVPEDVWEVLDRASGYAALWINVLATEAALGSMLEVPAPVVVSPRISR